MKYIIVFYLILSILFLSIGWLGHSLYSEYSNKSYLDGLYYGEEYNLTQQKVLENAYNRDSAAEWVCVNIQNMPYKRAVEVCQHEVGHEMFAEICEKNITKCFEVEK